MGKCKRSRPSTRDERLAVRLEGLAKLNGVPVDELIAGMSEAELRKVEQGITGKSGRGAEEPMCPGEPEELMRGGKRLVPHKAPVDDDFDGDCEGVDPDVGASPRPEDMSATLDEEGVKETVLELLEEMGVEVYPGTVKRLMSEVMDNEMMGIFLDTPMSELQGLFGDEYRAAVRDIVTAELEVMEE